MLVEGRTRWWWWGRGDTCVAGLWGNNGSGHVRGASVEGGVGPGVESIGVRCTRWKGKGFLAVSFAFSKEMVLVCFVGWVSWWWHGKRCFCCVVLCSSALCYVCPSTVFRHVSPFSGALWSTLLASSARSQPLKLSTLFIPLRFTKFMSFIFLLIKTDQRSKITSIVMKWISLDDRLQDKILLELVISKIVYGYFIT